MTGKKRSFAVPLLPLVPPPVYGDDVDVDTPSPARRFRWNDPIQGHNLGDVFHYAKPVSAAKIRAAFSR